MESNLVNRLLVFITIIVVIAIIAVPTTYKVVKVNRSRKALANEKLILEKAQKCIYDGKCKSNVITLKNLYDNLYIKDRVVNPYDKTLYNEESYVVVTKEGATLYLK